MKLAFSFTPAPDTTNGQTTCYACCNDPGTVDTCPRCHGTGQEP